MYVRKSVILRVQCMYDKQIILTVGTELTRRITDILVNEANKSIILFSCEATGKPVPTISWLFNGVKIKENDTANYSISIYNNETVIMSNLTLQSSTIGVYTCEANNAISNNSSSAVLTMIGELHRFYIIMSTLNNMSTYVHSCR